MKVGKSDYYIYRRAIFQTLFLLNNRVRAKKYFRSADLGLKMGHVECKITPPFVVDF
jgi:hypothetical protein